MYVTSVFASAGTSFCTRCICARKIIDIVRCCNTITSAGHSSLFVNKNSSACSIRCLPIWSAKCCYNVIVRLSYKCSSVIT